MLVFGPSLLLFSTNCRLWNGTDSSTGHCRTDICWVRAWPASIYLLTEVEPSWTVQSAGIRNVGRVMPGEWFPLLFTVPLIPHVIRLHCLVESTSVCSSHTASISRVGPRRTMAGLEGSCIALARKCLVPEAGGINTSANCDWHSALRIPFRADNWRDDSPADRINSPNWRNEIGFLRIGLKKTADRHENP